MPAPVCDGARMECSYGDGEVKLRVDTRGVKSGGSTPANSSQGAAGSSLSGSSGSHASDGSDGSFATTDDCLPLVHIAPFRGCASVANVNPLLPSGRRLCTPRPLGQWSAEIKCITLQDKKLVELRSTLRCALGGTIRFVDAGQEGVQVDSNLLENPSVFGAAESGSGGAGGGGGSGEGGGGASGESQSGAGAGATGATGGAGGAGMGAA